VLHPRQAWRSPAEYDTQARQLAAMFAENFKAFSADVGAGVLAAGPTPVGH
jgi:phosphoenolpyruvate carboxykinase (ATP)